MMSAVPYAVFAQTQGPGEVPGSTQTVGPPLQIGSGDLLTVTIIDAPDLSGRFRVDQKGYIELPLLDPFQVAGLTAEQAAALIEDKYIKAEILVAVPQGLHSSVFIEEFTSQGITVSGEVKTPGVYPAFGVRMLNDVITAAGGTTETASLKVIITRHGDPEHPITAVYDPRAIPRMIPEVQIFPGDTVLLPRAGTVYVLGAVVKGGGFILNGHDSVTAEKALALAGGTSRAPALKRAQLVRSLQGGGKELIGIRMDKVLKGEAADISMRDGDVLYIPTSTGKLAAQQAITSALGIGTSVVTYRTAYQ
jgi:polysaccharide export outer membrane protein